ncbi:MAG: hypothetical protein KAF91_31810 [Nostoc sp. TH1S01]|nr:hypothetical protein [Nostoc sp. TH1S01]
MKTQNQWLFELPPINQQLESDFSEGHRSKNQQTGGIESIRRYKPRGDDDSPLLDPRIPGEKPKEKGGVVIGNQSFRTATEARQAALQVAKQLNKERGVGHSIIREDPSKPGEQAHYHVVGPDGKRASGHFFYGKKPRFVHIKQFPKRLTKREFEVSFEGLPTGNFETSSTDWLFESPLPSTPAYTQCDFIDPRIDVNAQYALFEMLKGDIATRTAAISMLSAVKNGSLGGIYKEDQQVPAKRAQRISKTWWTLIPSGQSAICVTQPSSEPPIIVFKRSLTNRIQLGQALRTAWSTCRLSNPPAYLPSGKICPNRPLPKPPVKDTPKPPSTTLPTLQSDIPPEPPVTGPVCSQDLLDQSVQMCQQNLKKDKDNCSLPLDAYMKAASGAAGAINCWVGKDSLKRPLWEKALCTLEQAGDKGGDFYHYWEESRKCEQNYQEKLDECQRMARQKLGC